MNSTSVSFCLLAGIATWLWLAVNLMALRSYAITQGLPPAHAWKLFGKIWHYKEHPMRPSLNGLIASTLIFLICAGIAMHLGYPTEGPGDHTASGN